MREHERETRKNQQSPGPAKLVSAAAPKEPAKPSKATSREVAKEGPARPSTVDERRKAALAKEAARTSEAKRLLSGLNLRWADGSRGRNSALAIICVARGRSATSEHGARSKGCGALFLRRPALSPRKRLGTSRKAAADLTASCWRLCGQGAGFRISSPRASFFCQSRFSVVTHTRGASDPQPQQPLAQRALSRNSP